MKGRVAAMFVFMAVLIFFSPSARGAETHGHGAHDHGMGEEVPKTSKWKSKDLQEFRTPAADSERRGYFLNQHGEKVRISDYKGKIVLMDFIFTTCASGHCRLLNNKMRFIYRKFKDRIGKDIQMVSVSFDPEIDTPEILKRYSEDWDSDPSRWAFLTGTQGDIADLAKKHGVLFAWNDEAQTYDHTLRTVLIDRSGAEVKAYGGMDYQLQEVVDDINSLLAGKSLK